VAYLVTSDRRLFCATTPGVAFVATWCSPTVIANSSLWGQSDALYTAALLVAVAGALRRSTVLCAAAFGIALSIKFQAMFLSPAILVWLLLGVITWGAVPLAALAYVFLLTPAALAGRSVLDLASIYVRQTTTYHALALGAPNPWTVVSKRRITSIQYQLAVAAGLLVTTLANLVLIARTLTRPIRSECR
jgi:Gpi18-like mannosyltransferase